jgi:glucokinase
MILAGDVGGTKTHIGIFEPAPRRPIAIEVRTFPTNDFDGLPAIAKAFLGSRPANAIDAACFGVAGPVIDQSARMTNVPWLVTARGVAEAFGWQDVHLLNDLEAMAHAVPVLETSELHVLQQGTRHPAGNAVLIAAGTGLGESILHAIDGRFLPLPSEGGHTDFPARTDRELELVRFLRGRRGRVDVEAVVSGRGISNLYRFTHQGVACGAPVASGEEEDDPARIAKAALSGACAHCVEALGLFVSAYGAEAGNLALQGVATAGVYVGGGIAPKLIQALAAGPFMEAFLAKEPMRALMEKIPVFIILNREAALLGAAVHANDTLIDR